MDYKERLKQYLEEDTIYSEYKSGKCDMSDFDKFCIEHCKDIECLLNENQELKEQLEEINNFINKASFVNIEQLMLDYCAKVEQQKEFIEWLVKMSKDLFQNEEYGSSAIYGYILSKYKEIIGSKDE